MSVKPWSCVLTIFLLTLSVNQIFASHQVPDVMINGKDTYAIYANPLEQLPNIDSLRPKLFGGKNTCWTTGCYRTYKAEWTIIDSQLYLSGIFSCCFESDSLRSDLKVFFGKEVVDGRVKADWVTASLLSPQGNFILTLNTGYESFYDKEVVFNIEKGQLMGIKHYGYTKSRKSKFNDFTLSEFIYSNIRWDELPKLDKSVDVLVQFSANEQGVIDSVILLSGSDEIFNNEAVRVMKSIPGWSVCYKLGNFIRLEWKLKIEFSEKMRKEYNKK